MWREFFNQLFARFLSPQTARFILALASLSVASYGAHLLLARDREEEASQAAVFAVGQLFALATMAFSYYFGSTARRDDGSVEISNPPERPVPVDTGDEK